MAVKTGIARVYTSTDFSREIGTYVIHGAGGSFFSSWLSFFAPYRTRLEMTYDYSDDIGTEGYWPDKHRFFRNGHDIMEVIRANLTGKVHVNFRAWEKLVEIDMKRQAKKFFVDHENTPELMELNRTAYVHKVFLEFTNPNDAMRVKLILG